VEVALLADANLGDGLERLTELLGEIEQGRPLSAGSHAQLRRAGRFDAADPRRAGLKHYVSILRSAPRWYLKDVFDATFFPNGATMASIYDVDVQSRFLPLLYALRPFHLAYRAAQTLRARR
jgi:hypothetical protein